MRSIYCILRYFLIPDTDFELGERPKTQAARHWLAPPGRGVLLCSLKYPVLCVFLEPDDKVLP